MARRSLGKYFSAYFKMPVLGRKDLTAIEMLIVNDLRPERYHIACQGFEYDRVADIPSDSAPAVTLVIYTHAPCLRLKFARSWAELYCEDNNDVFAPVIERIRNVVARGERSGLWRASKYSVWMAPMLGFGMMAEVVILVYFGHMRFSAIYGGLALLTLAFIWWVIGYRAMLFRFSRISFE